MRKVEMAPRLSDGPPHATVPGDEPEGVEPNHEAYKKSRSGGWDDHTTMTRGTNGRRRRYTKRVRRRRRGQKGGVFPALLPLLAVGAKAAALGALGGAASHGAKKVVDAMTRRKRKAIKR